MRSIGSLKDVSEPLKVIVMRETNKNSLAHEWELLAVPEISVVHRAHQDVGKNNTDVLVYLEPKRIE